MNDNHKVNINFEITNKNIKKKIKLQNLKNLSQCENLITNNINKLSQESEKKKNEIKTKSNIFFNQYNYGILKYHEFIPKFSTKKIQDFLNYKIPEKKITSVNTFKSTYQKKEENIYNLSTKNISYNFDNEFSLQKLNTQNNINNIPCSYKIHKKTYKKIQSLKNFSTFADSIIVETENEKNFNIFNNYESLEERNPNKSNSIGQLNLKTFHGIKKNNINLTNSQNSSDLIKQNFLENKKNIIPIMNNKLVSLSIPKFLEINDPNLNSYKNFLFEKKVKKIKLKNLSWKNSDILNDFSSNILENNNSNSNSDIEYGIPYENISTTNKNHYKIKINKNNNLPFSNKENSEILSDPKIIKTDKDDYSNKIVMNSKNINYNLSSCFSLHSENDKIPRKNFLNKKISDFFLNKNSINNKIYISNSSHTNSHEEKNLNKICVSKKYVKGNNNTSNSDKKKSLGEKKINKKHFNFVNSYNKEINEVHNYEKDFCENLHKKKLEGKDYEINNKRFFNFDTQKFSSTFKINSLLNYSNIISDLNQVEDIFYKNINCIKDKHIILPKNLEVLKDKNLHIVNY